MSPGPSRIPFIPAVVLGVEHPRGVAVVRSLGRIGVPVIGVDHDRTARGMHSRYLSEKIFVGQTHDEVLPVLESLAGERKPVLIATTDRYLTLVSQHFERLSQSFTLTTPPWSVVNLLMDKSQCYALARSIGLGAPQSFTPATVEELDRTIADLDFERRAYVLTKAWPVGTPTDAVTNRFTRVGGLDRATLRERCLEALERLGELPMIAEIVPGTTETCVGLSMILDSNREVVASYGIRRLQLRPYEKDRGFRHPYELGANVYCESVRDEEATGAARRLLQAAGYFGTATVEFRRDAVDGTLKLIKIDPRFVRATSLSTALGVDFPQTLYRTFTGAPVSVPDSHAEGVPWIWLTWYVQTVGPRVAARNLPSIIGNLRRGAAAYFSRDDLKPFLVDVKRWAPGQIKGSVRSLQRALGQIYFRPQPLPVSNPRPERK